MADLPPSSPSITVNCHSGRVRSNASATSSVARSSNCRMVPGAGNAIRRTWCAMLNSVSATQRGGPREAGAGCTRWRSRGMIRDARSIRATNASKFGARSRMVMLANVEVRNGSFSALHINASASLMRSSKRGMSWFIEVPKCA